MLHDTLWEANQDLVALCRTHPFVTGIADGSLPDAAFGRYVAQDSFYLRAYFRAYALAAAKAERIEHLTLLHELLGGALAEMRMHAENAGRLGIDVAETEPLTATRRYVDFLLELAWRRGLGEIVAGMTPCMRLYAHLGGELAAIATPGLAAPYREWVELYAGEAFQTLADRHDALLDEVAADTPEVRQVYRRAMALERAFFDAALRGDDPARHGRGERGAHPSGRSG